MSDYHGLAGFIIGQLKSECDQQAAGGFPFPNGDFPAALWFHGEPDDGLQVEVRYEPIGAAEVAECVVCLRGNNYTERTNHLEAAIERLAGQLEDYAQHHPDSAPGFAVIYTTRAIADLQQAEAERWRRYYDGLDAEFAAQAVDQRIERGKRKRQRRDQ